MSHLQSYYADLSPLDYGDGLLTTLPDSILAFYLQHSCQSNG